MRLFLTVFFFLTGIIAASSQTVLTLEEAIATAIENNYDIRIAKYDSASAAIDESYIYTAFLPRLNATASRTFTRNKETLKYKSVSRSDTSGISKVNNINLGLALDWTIFDGLRMFAIRDRVRELVHLGQLNIKTQVTNTVSDVLRTYYNIVQQKQQLNAIIEQKSISEERVKLADKKLSVGLGAKPELLQAKVDLNAFISAQHRQNTQIALVKEQLNLLMGVDKGTTYEVEDSIPINTELVLGEVMNNIELTNPDLLFSKKNIDISKIILREARADYFPTVSFISNYNFSRINNTQNLNPFQVPFRQNGGLVYGLSASIPIFNGFNATRQVKQAKLSIFQQGLLYDNQRWQVEVSVKNAFKEYELQKQNLALEEQNILLAKENVMIALERFRQGVSTYIELREAQISLADGYNRLIAARYTAKVAEVELMRLKGTIIQAAP